jgi:hypothetical protein
VDALNGFLALITIATIVRFLVDRLKDILPAATLERVGPPVWSLIISLGLSFAFNLDLFLIFGWQSALPFLPQILTGLAISAGADPLHNLYAKLREGRE